MPFWTLEGNIGSKTSGDLSSPWLAGEGTTPKVLESAFKKTEFFSKFEFKLDDNKNIYNFSKNPFCKMATMNKKCVSWAIGVEAVWGLQNIWYAYWGVNTVGVDEFLKLNSQADIQMNDTKIRNLFWYDTVGSGFIPWLKKFIVLESANDGQSADQLISGLSLQDFQRYFRQYLSEVRWKRIASSVRDIIYSLLFLVAPLLFLPMLGAARIVLGFFLDAAAQLRESSQVRAVLNELATQLSNNGVQVGVLERLVDDLCQRSAQRSAMGSRDAVVEIKDNLMQFLVLVQFLEKYSLTGEHLEAVGEIDRLLSIHKESLHPYFKEIKNDIALLDLPVDQQDLRLKQMIGVYLQEVYQNHSGVGMFWVQRIHQQIIDGVKGKNSAFVRTICHELLVKSVEAIKLVLSPFVIVSLCLFELSMVIAFSRFSTKKLLSSTTGLFNKFYYETLDLERGQSTSADFLLSKPKHHEYEAAKDMPAHSAFAAPAA